MVSNKTAQKFTQHILLLLDDASSMKNLSKHLFNFLTVLYAECMNKMNEKLMINKMNEKLIINKSVDAPEKPEFSV